jgi:hypothetical protein
MASKEEGEQYVFRPLKISDIPFLVALEQSSFPRNEAASLEKVSPQ